MAARRRSALAFSDWVKVGVVLVVGIAAASWVYAVYTEPFYLLDDIQRQRQYQEYESTRALSRPVPAGGGGAPAELRPSQ